MDNLHEEASRLADSHSSYMLAKMLLIEQKERIHLAAHVERLRDAGKPIRHELAQWALTEQDPETSAAMCQFDQVSRETPTTSLIRLKLIAQAELMEQLAAGPAQAWDYIEMTDLANDLRQQAEAQQ